MGGGGGDNSSDNTVRFAPYLEDAHRNFLGTEGEVVIDPLFGYVYREGTGVPNKNFVTVFNEALDSSPYGNAVNIDLQPAFFGGSYAIGDFPSLYDMFGKFIAGVDLHDLFDQTLNDLLTSPILTNAYAAQADLLDDDIEQRIYPRFEAGMRDIGAINSSAFATGRAILEDTRIKALNDYSTKVQLKVMDVATQQWQAHLTWNQSTIEQYRMIIRQYYEDLMNANTQNIDMQVKDAIFNLGLFDSARAIIGALNGAPASTAGAAQQGPSQMQKSISGAAAGAAVGAQVGGGYGALIGGVIGLAASFF